jgi:hypothetical protein
MRQVQHETGIVKETIVFYFTDTEATLQCGQVLQNVASPQNMRCVWNTTNVCPYTAVSVQTGVRLVFTHVNTAPYARGHTSQSRLGNVCSRDTILCHGAQQCFAAGYSTPRILSDSTGRQKINSLFIIFLILPKSRDPLWPGTFGTPCI